MVETDPHAWLFSRLDALVADAEQAGIARDVTVALVTDIINGPPFNVGPPAGDENWNKDAGEPDTMANEAPDSGLLPERQPLIGTGRLKVGRGRTGGRGWR